MKRVMLELQPCCRNRSGIGLYTYELARRMRGSGDVQFCGQVFNFLGRNDNSQAFSGIDMPIVESRLMPYGVYRRIWKALPLSYGTVAGCRADASVFFNFIVPPRVSGKIIDTIHDMAYLRFPETLDAKNLRRITDGIAGSVDRSARIVTVSEFTKREMMELLHVPAEMISIVPCAPSLTMEAADFGDVQAKFGVKKPYIFYMGSIEPRKNLARLIRAFDLLKKEEGIPHQLVLAGGSGWNNQEIYRAAEQASCTEDILFTGYISAAEKNALYKHASALAFPSLYEGFGMPPLEAMHWDCPVVCADAASLPEVVGDAAELVKPMDAADIARGLYRVVSDPAYAQELVLRGREQLKKFSWDDSAMKLAQVCREVLA